MRFITEYNRKCVSAEDAVSLVQPGNWVDYGAFCCSPIFLDAALAKRAGALYDVKVRGLAFTGVPAVAREELREDSFIYNSWHFSGGERKAHDKGRCHFIPFLYHDGPSYYQNNIRTDVCMLRVGRMDKNGFFNYGIGNSCQRAMIENAKTVIVEVNNQMPYCMGGHSEMVHISEVDCIVETDNKPLFTLPDAVITDVDQEIASLIAAKIEDGSCLQLGIGGMPNAVGKLIAGSDIKNLGVHTEMLADAYLDMFEAGKITNSQKVKDKWKMVYTFALGSKRLYDFLHNNPDCASYPSDYTNNLANIMANDKMISINNAIEVDLFGQVSSESAGFRQITGTGGQFDFAYGASHSKGGKSFICLSSTITDKKGNVKSRIRPLFTAGTIVTLPRTITQHVVTEYGIAQLKGKSTWERAEALINIAHPDFRDELIRDAEQMGIWTPANRSQMAEDAVRVCA